jgi:hypothetical protein
VTLLAPVAVGWGLMVAAPALLHGVWLWAAMTAGSCLGGMSGVLTVTVRQQLTPPAIRGAVGGAYRAVIMGAMPMGAALGALLQRLLGTPDTFLLFGAGRVLLAVPVYRTSLGRASVEHDAGQDAGQETGQDAERATEHDAERAAERADSTTRDQGTNGHEHSVSNTSGHPEHR